jgi:hypothetical protein
VGGGWGWRGSKNRKGSSIAGKELNRAACGVKKKVKMEALEKADIIVLVMKISFIWFESFNSDSLHPNDQSVE